MKTYLKYIWFILSFTFLLIVSCSEEAPVNLTSTPIAHAGTDQLVEIYDVVLLDGSQSTKTENVEYIWTLNYKPPGSITILSDSSASNPIFSPDLTGFYNVKLVVKNKEMYSDPDFVTIQAIDTDTENYFPQKVGNKWKYKITDEEGIVKDTITVEIVGTTTLQNGEPASVWVYSVMWPYGINDTLYLVTRGDTLVYYYRYYQNHLKPFIGYILPFRVGIGWGAGWLREWEWIGEFTVLEYNSVSVEIGTFPGAYKSYHTFPEPEGGPNILYNWIVPRVGLVKVDFHDAWSTGAHTYYNKQYWELIWYNLVE